MSERLTDALRRRIWRELYRVPIRLAVLRALFQRLMKAQRPPHHNATGGCNEIDKLVSSIAQTRRATQ